jgi:hypothetical protein
LFFSHLPRCKVPLWTIPPLRAMWIRFRLDRLSFAFQDALSATLVLSQCGHRIGRGHDQTQVGHIVGVVITL